MFKNHRLDEKMLVKFFWVLYTVGSLNIRETVKIPFGIGHAEQLVQSSVIKHMKSEPCKRLAYITSNKTYQLDTYFLLKVKKRGQWTSIRWSDIRLPEFIKERMCTCVQLK